MSYPAKPKPDFKPEEKVRHKVTDQKGEVVGQNTIYVHIRFEGEAKQTSCRAHNLERL